MTKEDIIKKVALDLDVNQDVVSKIISHQFDSASIATQTQNSIEISGFGKFLFNMPRAIKTMQKYESQLKYYNEQLLIVTSETKKRNLLMRIESAEKNIKNLKPRLCQD